ncbi:hypothetical protein AVEN_186079-1 [Araneus ventricosus]|uniref:Uncharacterized protein n=1 Tax=Araneus ventricosus TaxID=182803 RepID=A0A4Y2M6E7_ARAVE|nr:hypothetical protein AVEN_186079-1 [Araneus ventricosus]
MINRSPPLNLLQKPASLGAETPSMRLPTRILCPRFLSLPFTSLAEGPEQLRGGWCHDTNRNSLREEKRKERQRRRDGKKSG